MCSALWMDNSEILFERLSPRAGGESCINSKFLEKADVLKSNSWECVFS